MKSLGFVVRRLLAVCATFGVACCSQADPLVAVPAVGRMDVPDVATMHIGFVRLRAVNGEHAIVPYVAAENRVTRFFVPERGAVRDVALQHDMDMSYIGEGCISQDALKISIPEWTAEGGIFLHVIDRSSGKHDKRAMTSTAPVLRAAFDCTALIAQTRTAAGEFLSYRVYGTGNAPAADAWSLPIRTLVGRDGPVSITGIHAEGERINLVAVDARAGNARLIAGVSSDGRKVDEQLAAALFDPSVQRILATAYGYAADKRASLLERSAEYLLLDSSLKVLGRARVAASGLPVVAVPGRKTFLLTNLLEVSGQPRLEIVRIEADGRIQRDPDGVQKNAALSNVVFGTTVLGVVGENVFAVGSGTELQKSAAGFQLRDALYYFPLQLL